MQIENSFVVPVPLERGWEALTDIERIVPCMPGATLTEVSDDGIYKGSVAIRLGPVALSFGGTARFVEIDQERHRAVVRAEGRDAKGRGNVAADVQFELQPGEGGTEVHLTTDLKLSGMVAQYGRGSGMIADVAGHWVKSFSECLGEQLADGPSDESAAPSGRRPADDADAPDADVERPKSAAEPVPVLGLGVKVLLAALTRAVRRLFGR